MTAPATSQASTPQDAARFRRRVIGQGALLSLGFGGAQALSFARNALLGYWLSKGDFGIAVTIALALQMLETLSDVGVERLVVQADDADGRLLGAGHAAMTVRGALTSLLLLAFAGPIARFFEVEFARWAFEMAALVPLIKGFMHLEPRQRQRALDNRTFVIVEVAPQALVLSLTVPVLVIAPGYGVAVWLSVLQAVTAVIVSHLVAGKPYRIIPDRTHLQRILAFGWPIWLSAFPLVAVYQGDRMIVAKAAGMEALAGYTAAFMITMVPGLLAGKVAHALLLPLFAEVSDDGRNFRRRFRLTTEVVTIFAAVFVAGFTLAGGRVLPWAFGPNYYGLGAVVGWLALMWGLRMVQAMPGMALMARGETHPLLIAGCLRASALALSLLVAAQGGGMAAIAACGSIGELASLVYIAWRVGKLQKGLTRGYLLRVAFLLPASLFAGGVALVMPFGSGTVASLATALITGATIASVGLLFMPALRRTLGESADVRVVIKELTARKPVVLDA